MSAPPVIHVPAVIGEDVHLGAGVTVWPFASVIRRSVIGAGGTVGSCAIVDGARLGPGVRIGHGAQVHPGVVAGGKVFVGPGAILCNDLWPWLAARDFDLEALIEGRRVAIIVGDGATIGAGAIVLPGVRLGMGCVIAAGAVVERSVPPMHLLNRDGGLRSLQGRPVAERMRLVA